MQCGAEYAMGRSCEIEIRLSNDVLVEWYVCINGGHRWYGVETARHLVLIEDSKPSQQRFQVNDTAATFHITADDDDDGLVIAA
jgi:hypothetical protein